MTHDCVRVSASPRLRVSASPRLRVLSVPLLTVIVFAGVADVAGQVPVEFAAQPAIQKAWGSLNTLDFTENLGQFPPEVRFIGNARGGKIVLRTDGLLHQLHRPRPARVEPTPHHPPHPKFRRHAVDATHVFLRFVDANPEPDVRGMTELAHLTNYYRGADRAKWRSGCRSFAEVAYEDVWPGVGVRLVAQDGHPRYDFIVAPGADPNVIRLRFEGVRALHIDAETGSLVAETALGSIVQQPPLVLQKNEDPDAEKLHEILDGRFRLIDDRTFGFEIDPAFDRSRPLIIDPVLIYGTYVSGSADEGNSGGFDGEVVGGPAMSVYFATDTLSDDIAEWPGGGTPGGGTVYNAAEDVAVFRILPQGAGQNDLIFRTFLGGTGMDRVFRMHSASDGGVYVGGEASANFPTNPCAFRTTVSGPCDGFVTKLTMTGGMEASTYLGNDSGVDHVVGLGTFEFGAGATPLPWDPDEFITGQGYIEDAGGTCTDCCPELDGDYVYTTMFTAGTGLPITTGTTNNAYQSFIKPGGPQGLAEVAITILTPDLSSVAYSTYLGSDGVDSPYDLAVTSTGTVWIAGGCGNGPQDSTSYDCAIHFPLGSSDPVGNPPWDSDYDGASPAQTYVEGFLTHLRPWVETPTTTPPCSWDTDQLLFSTFVGGGHGESGENNEYVFDLHLDDQDRVYFCGATPSGCASFDVATSTCSGSDDFPSFAGLPEDQGGRPHDDALLQTTNGKSQFDSFFGMLDADGARVFLSYFAGTCPDFNSGDPDEPGNYEWAYGIVTDAEGRIYVAGSTSASDLPVGYPGTPPPFQAVHADNGAYDPSDCEVPSGVHPDLDLFDYPRDAYLAVFQLVAGRPELAYATYIGWLGDDWQNGIHLDDAGHLTIGGVTGSGFFPTTPGAMQEAPMMPYLNYDAWMVQFQIGQPFIRGDANFDGTLDNLDLDAIRSEINNPTSTCKDAADYNDDGVVDKADYNALFNYLAGVPGIYPALDCAPDLTIDPLPACTGYTCP